MDAVARDAQGATVIHGQAELREQREGLDVVGPNIRPFLRSRILLPLAFAAGLIFGASSADASLWDAARATREAPLPAVSISVEKVADDFARDIYWLVGSHSADLFSTAWAIHRCATCVEKNPLTPTAEARIALKSAGVASMGLTLWKLRRSGHGRAANVLRWTAVAVNLALVANNSAHAFRRR